jgi:hypothetical protein
MDSGTSGEREGGGEGEYHLSRLGCHTRAGRLTLYPTLTEEVAGPCELDGRGFEE